MFPKRGSRFATSPPFSVHPTSFGPGDLGSALACYPSFFSLILFWGSKLWKHPRTTPTPLTHTTHTPRPRPRLISRLTSSKMGNSPSTSKPATPTPRHHEHHGSAARDADRERERSNDSPRGGKKEPKNLISSAHQYHQRSTASSPEASVVSAQGSTIGPRATNSKPLSILNPPQSNSPSSQYSTGRSSVSKQRPSEDRNEPSKPVAVPVPVPSNSQYNPADSASIRSPPQYGEDSLLTSGPASSSVQDMSYGLTRPPRLPLPIQEEIHTPGSPIIAPTDIGDPIDDIEDLDKEQAGSDLTRKASGLSNATDEDDTEELRVDKTRPTVPTRVEWLQGGHKVYVTGTPFQWSRKQRLHPA